MSATIEEVLKTVSFLSTKYDDLSGKIIKLEEENVHLKQKKTDILESRSTRSEKWNEHAPGQCKQRRTVLTKGALSHNSSLGGILSHQVD